MERNNDLSLFLSGKSEQALSLFNYFILEYEKIGPISFYTTKTMIGIINKHRRIALVTQLGKNFVHIVFPFKQAYADNLCFQKIAQVPDDQNQFNHHLRIYNTEDINNEVLKFMVLAYENN